MSKASTAGWPGFRADVLDQFMIDRAEMAASSTEVQPWHRGAGRRVSSAQEWYVKNGSTQMLLSHDDPRRRRRGEGAVWNEGEVQLEHHFSRRSMSLYASTNPTRIIHREGLRAGFLIPGTHAVRDRHGNSIHPDQLQGVTMAEVRTQVLAKLATIASKVGPRYEEILKERLSIFQPVPVRVRWTKIQLYQDLPAQSPKEVVEQYIPLMTQNLNALVARGGDGPMALGRIWKAPRFSIYSKGDRVRFEVELDRKRIIDATGSADVRVTSETLQEQLELAWAHWACPVIFALEQDRTTPEWRPSLSDLLATRPNLRRLDVIRQVFWELSTYGWTRVTDPKRRAIRWLKHLGLVEACPAPGRVKVAPGLNGFFEELGQARMGDPAR